MIMFPHEYRPALPRGPIIERPDYIPTSDCPEDGCDGTLHTVVHGVETVCDTCGVVDAPRETDLVAEKQRREQTGGRPDHDTYSNGHRRCYGGYTAAYEAAGDDPEQYAINQESPDGSALWTPHERSAAVE